MSRLLSGKQLVDGSIPESKLQPGAVTWKQPVAVKHLVGNATVSTINGLSPTQGDAYVVTDSGTITLGSVAVTPGDLVEYDGAAWVEIVSAVGGFPPAGTRVLLATQTALIPPYTDTSHDGQVREFDGGSLTAADTGEAVDGYAVAVSGDGGVFEGNVLLFSGTVPSGTWIGGGDITAGAGLSKTLNTLDVGDINRGVQVNADDLQVDASEIASSTGGLQQVSGGGNEHLLELKLDTTTGGGESGLAVGANGLLIGSGAAGVGLTGGAGSPLAINQTAEAVTFSGTAVWSFPADNLQVTTVPDSANDAVNKSYVDSLVAASATWRNPVRDSDLVDVVGANPGTGAAVAAAYGITTGDNVSFIATAGFTFDAGGATVVASAGDIVNLTMTSPTAGDYSLIQAAPLATGDRFIVGAEHGTAIGILDSALGQIDIGGDDATVTAGSFVIGDTYRITTVGTTDFTLIGASANTVGVSFVATGVGAGTGDALDVTNNIKKGDLLEFTGTGDGSTAASWSFPEGRSGLAAGETEIPQGTTVLNNDPDSVHYGHTFLYNADANAWVEISGPGAIGDGAGLLYSGNTLNIGDAGKGVQVNADDLQVDASEIAGNGLEQVAGGGNEHLLTLTLNTTDGGGVSGLEVGANGLRIDAGAAGAGLVGGDGDALAVGDANRGVQINANDVEIDGSEMVAANGGLQENSTNSWQIEILAADTSVSTSASGLTAAQPGTNNIGMTGSVTTADDQAATATTVAAASANGGRYELYVNGLLEDLREDKNGSAFLSNDGGSTAAAFSAVVNGSTIRWRGSEAGYELDANDVLDLHYNPAV